MGWMRSCWPARRRPGSFQRARSRGGRRGGRPRQHQRRSDAHRRQLSENPAIVMHDARFVLIGAIVLAFGLAAIAISLVRSMLHRAIEALEIGEREQREAVHARARQLVGALTLVAYGVAAIASVSLTLARFGVGGIRWDPRVLGRWVLLHGVNAGI